MRLLKGKRLWWAPLLLVVSHTVAAFTGQNLLWSDRIHPEVAVAMQDRIDEWLSLIVTLDPGSDAVEEAASRLGARITNSWPFIHAFAAKVPVSKILTLASLDGVRMVLRDHDIDGAALIEDSGGSGVSSAAVANPALLTNTYNLSVNANQVWAQGYMGQNITIAVVDSGVEVNPSADDLSGRISSHRNFNTSSEGTQDKYGHGTHVAGIIAGDGTGSSGKYVGIAPNANILNVRFSDGKGTSSEKDLVTALQWVYDMRGTYNIRVVNISSSVSTPAHYKESPTAAAVEQLWNAGIVVVVSAGNRGTDYCSVCSAPGHDPHVITVGAVDDNNTADPTDDVVKDWSSRGLTLDLHSKPDIMAPGSHIIAYMPTGALRQKYPTNIVDTYYFQMSGTSMAAPVVSGVVALMLQANPNLTPNQVKWILKNTARGYLNQMAGTPGVVDAAAAVLYSGTIGTVNQGLDPSIFIDPNTGLTNYSNTLWSNGSWSTTLFTHIIEF